MPIDFKGWGSPWSQSCAWEQKNYEMNKCLSLVHLTSTVGSQSSGSDESTSSVPKCPKLDLDPPGTKSFSGRLTLIAAAPCSGLRLNFRAGNHLPGTPQLRLPTSPFRANFRVADHPQEAILRIHGPHRATP